MKKTKQKQKQQLLTNNEIKSNAEDDNEDGNVDAGVPYC